MALPQVSVVVVSRDRPTHLALCLRGLSQLYYHPFEIVLVGDEAAVNVAERMGLTDRIKVVRFEEANISAARNAGISVAAGEIVAFIDDDAVPEPTWLDHLIRPFAVLGADAAGGYVLGRNGISLQWGGRMIDGAAVHTESAVNEPAGALVEAEPGSAVRTEGTNMAFRRDRLVQLGGFDPGFRFYLDDADLNMRLADSGAKTALVPRALVHHGFAASSRRRADRAPTNLSDIGASLTRYLGRHCAHMPPAEALKYHRRLQETRLHAFLIRGLIEPRDVRRLMASFDEGVRQTFRADAPRRFGSDATWTPFNAKRTEPDHRVVADWFWNRDDLSKNATDLVNLGRTVTAFRFSPTALFHKVQYTDQGYWLQTGGLFGRSERTGPLFQRIRFHVRVAKEVKRTHSVRSL